MKYYKTNQNFTIERKGGTFLNVSVLKSISSSELLGGKK